MDADPDAAKKEAADNEARAKAEQKFQFTLKALSTQLLQGQI